MLRPVEVDWIYLRMKMREYRGGGSFRDLAEQFPSLSVSTCNRFLSQGTVLDLTSLLCVIEVLDLEVADVFVRRSKQLNFFQR